MVLGFTLPYLSPFHPNDKESKFFFLWHLQIDQRKTKTSPNCNKQQRGQKEQPGAREPRESFLHPSSVNQKMVLSIGNKSFLQAVQKYSQDVSGDATHTHTHTHLWANVVMQRFKPLMNILLLYASKP
jgi:hypothetical protein